MRVLIEWRLKKIIVAVTASVADQFGEMLMGELPVLFHILWIQNHSAMFSHCSVL